MVRIELVIALLAILEHAVYLERLDAWYAEHLPESPITPEPRRRPR